MVNFYELTLTEKSVAVRKQQASSFAFAFETRMSERVPRAWLSTNQRKRSVPVSDYREWSNKIPLHEAIPKSALTT